MDRLTKHFLPALITLALTGVANGQAELPQFPRLKNLPEISIPEEARSTGIGGELGVRVEIDGNGNVTKVTEARGPGPICLGVTRADVVALRSAAREAAKAAKFEPLKKGQLDWTWVRFKIPGKENLLAEEKLERFALSPKTPELRERIARLPKPPYPPAARALRADGTVTVELLVQENGSVFSARAVSGHPLLRAPATQAACGAEFKPSNPSGSVVKSVWVITYNFVP